MERRAALANAFVTEMQDLAPGFAQSSGEVADSAKNLSATAEETSRQAQAVAPHVNGLFLQTVRTAPDARSQAAISTHEKQAAEAMKIADAWLSQREWFAGSAFSFGDIAMGVIYWRYLGLDCVKPEPPHLAGWLEALEDREPFRNTVMAVPRAKTLAEWNRIERETA